MTAEQLRQVRSRSVIAAADQDSPTSPRQSSTAGCARVTLRGGPQGTPPAAACSLCTAPDTVRLYSITAAPLGSAAWQQSRSTAP